MTPLTTAAAAWRKLPARHRRYLLERLAKDALLFEGMAQNPIYKADACNGQTGEDYYRDAAEASRLAVKVLRAAVRSPR